MIAKLPLVPIAIINLTRLTAGVCMKVRFKSKITSGFFPSLAASRLRDSSSPLRGSLAAQEKPLAQSKHQNSRNDLEGISSHSEKSLCESRLTQGMLL